MTFWQRLRATQFKYDVQGYVSDLVHNYVSVRTEYQNGLFTIYIIESEIDLIVMQSYTLDEIKLARTSKAYRNEILKGIRNQISLGYPDIKLFDNPGI